MTNRGGSFPECRLIYLISLYLKWERNTLKKTCLLKFWVYFHFRIEESIDPRESGTSPTKTRLLNPSIAEAESEQGWKNSLKWQQVGISCYKEPAKNKAKNKVSWRKHHQNSFCKSPKSPGEVLAAPALGGFHIPSEENGWSIICERLVLADPRAGFAFPGEMKYMLTCLVQLSKVRWHILQRFKGKWV